MLSETVSPPRKDRGKAHAASVANASSGSDRMHIDRGLPVIVRYLNCTSNKPLHLGHLRNIVLGDALAGSLRALGVPAVRHFIGEDTGRFMTEAMVAIAEAEASGVEIPSPGKGADRFVGECYANYRRARAQAAGGAPAAKVEGCAQTDYPAGNDAANELMRALLRRERSARSLRDRVKRLALAGQQATLRRLGVVFDFCDFESAEDEGIAAFVARADDMGLLGTGEDGGRHWTHSPGRSLRLVNASGQFEESARLISFNARAANSRAASFATVVIAGTEWSRSMLLYPGFLAACGVDMAERYQPTFYGMVLLGGKKMASSTGTGILVDDLLDEVAGDERLIRLSRRLKPRVTSERLAVLVIRAFLLATARMEKIDFTMERLMSPDINPGWQIASALAHIAPGNIEAGGRCETATIRDAAERRSFEHAIADTRRLADRIVGGADDPDVVARFIGGIDALCLLRNKSGFAFASTPSLLSI